MRMHHIRGYTAIGHGGAAALADALRSVRALRRIDVPGAGAVASTIEAGVAAHNADWETVRLRLKDAQAAFQAADMVAYAAAVGWRLAEAERNNDAREAARGTFIGLGVRRPERMIDVLAPLPSADHGRGTR